MDAIKRGTVSIDAECAVVDGQNHPFGMAGKSDDKRGGNEGEAYAWRHAHSGNPRGNALRPGILLGSGWLAKSKARISPNTNFCTGFFMLTIFCSMGAL